MKYLPLVVLLGAAPLLWLRAADKPAGPALDAAAPAKTETATFALG